MYRFKVTYKRNVELLIVEKFFAIDMDSFSTNDFKCKDRILVAWDWALGRAFLEIPDGFSFTGIELIFD